MNPSNGEIHSVYVPEARTPLIIINNLSGTLRLTRTSISEPHSLADAGVTVRLHMDPGIIVGNKFLLTETGNVLH